MKKIDKKDGWLERLDIICSVCVCLLAALSFSAAQDETLLQNCNLQTQVIERLPADLKVNC